MKANHVLDSPCPNCNERLDSAMGVSEDAAPSPGDYTICVYCAELLVFDNELRHTRPSPEQMSAMMQNTEFRTAWGTLRELIRERES